VVADMGAAASVAFDAKGHLLVLSRGPNPLTEFDADGKLLSSDLFQVQRHGLFSH
jgi:uncharacterized protein YjiK